MYGGDKGNAGCDGGGDGRNLAFRSNFIAKNEMGRQGPHCHGNSFAFQNTAEHVRAKADVVLRGSAYRSGDFSPFVHNCNFQDLSRLSASQLPCQVTEDGGFTAGRRSGQKQPANPVPMPENRIGCAKNLMRHTDIDGRNFPQRCQLSALIHAGAANAGAVPPL